MTTSTHSHKAWTDEGSRHIGAALAEQLLQRGERVLGLDNLNPYYSPALTRARLQRLQWKPGAEQRFAFVPMDLEDGAAMAELFAR